MPLTINRPVSVYQLSDNDDLRACFEALAAAGWLCSLVAHDDPVVWDVRLQHNANRSQVQATLDDVIVTDGSSVEVQSVDKFNVANPGNKIGKVKP